MADVALVKARSRHYIGSALVSLLELSFENEFRKFDEKNVHRPQKIFVIEGCKRYDPINHVPALITRRDLKRAIRKSGVPLKDLKHHEPPYIDMHRAPSLVCLHGFHRIAAARAFLGPHEQWWVLDLYQADGMSREVSRSIGEQYENSKGFDDGYIFQSLRHYQRLGDQAGENKWLARLSQSKRRDLKQLQRSSAFRDLREALDDLLSLPGLWQAFRIGTFHRLLTMRCNEELVAYLQHIKHIWECILDRNPAAFRLLDSSTVLKLQGRCPRLSSDDQSYISSLFEMQEVFPQIRDKQLLSRIHKNISVTDWIIPSLHTFLEDTKFLEPCSKILRRLLPPSYRGTIHSGLGRCFAHHGSGILRIEHAAMEFLNLQNNSNLGPRSGYRQLWLYALRNFPYMGDVKPRKNRQRPEASKYNRDVSECWNTLGKLAKELGFVTPETERLCLADGTTTSGLRTAPFEPQLTTDMDIDWRLENRCGRMFENAFNKDSHHLFLLNIYVSKPPPQRQHLTSFGTTAQIVQSFLGPSRLGTDTGSIEESQAEAMSNQVSRHANSEVSPDIDMMEDTTLDALGRVAEIHTQQLPSSRDEMELNNPGLEQNPNCDHSTTQIPVAHLNSNSNDDQTATVQQQAFPHASTTVHINDQVPAGSHIRGQGQSQFALGTVKPAEQELASETEGQRQEALVSIPPTTPFPRHFQLTADAFRPDRGTLPHTPFPRSEGLEGPLSREPKSQKARARKHAERRKAGIVLKGHRQPQSHLFIKVPTRALSPSSFTFSNEGLPPLPTHAPTLPASHAAFSQPLFKGLAQEQTSDESAQSSRDEHTNDGSAQENAQGKISDRYQEQTSDESAQCQEKAQERVSDDPAQGVVQTGEQRNESGQGKGQDGTLDEPMEMQSSERPKNTQSAKMPEQALVKPDVQRLVDKKVRINKPGQAKRHKRVSNKPAQGNTQKLDKLALIKRLEQGKRYKPTSDEVIKKLSLEPKRVQTERREGSKRMLNETQQQDDVNDSSSLEPRAAYRKLNYFNNVIEDEHQYCFDAVGFVDAFIHKYLTTKQTEALRLPYCVIDHLESTSRIMCYAPNSSGRELLNKQISQLLKEGRFFVWPNQNTQRFESVNVRELQAHDAYIMIAAIRQRTWSNVGQWKKHELSIYPGLYVPCYNISEQTWKSIDAESLRREDILRSAKTKDAEFDEIS